MPVMRFSEIAARLTASASRSSAFNGNRAIPLVGSPVDVFYADAPCESIRRGTDDARRLARATGWLDAGWRNASGLTDDLRIPALFAGFEVLFDSDDKTIVLIA